MAFKNLGDSLTYHSVILHTCSLAPHHHTRFPASPVPTREVDADSGKLRKVVPICAMLLPAGTCLGHHQPRSLGIPQHLCPRSSLISGTSPDFPDLSSSHNLHLLLPGPPFFFSKITSSFLESLFCVPPLLSRTLHPQFSQSK